MRRPTSEEIQAAAERHVAYDWAASPGTHDRGILWTYEDTKAYMIAYRTAIDKKKERCPMR